MVICYPNAVRYNASVMLNGTGRFHARAVEVRMVDMSSLSTYLNNEGPLFSTNRHDPEENVEIACFPTEPRESRLSPPGSHPRHDCPQIPPTVRR